MTLTREQAIAEHRKMWRWIATETEKESRKVLKQDYLEQNGYSGISLCYSCFLCEFTSQRDKWLDCSLCPIDWDSEKDSGMCQYKSPRKLGYYGEWLCTNYTEWQQAAELASIIAELPEREV